MSQDHAGGDYGWWQGGGSAATAGEGTRNYPCSAQAAAVLPGLAAWWLDPAIRLGIAAVAAREGIESWRSDDCC